MSGDLGYTNPIRGALKKLLQGGGSIELSKTELVQNTAAILIADINRQQLQKIRGAEISFSGRDKPMRIRKSLGVGKGIRINWKDSRLEVRLLPTDLSAIESTKLAYTLTLDLAGDRLAYPIEGITSYNGTGTPTPTPEPTPTPTPDTTAPSFNAGASSISNLTSQSSTHSFSLNFTDSGSGVLRSSLTGSVRVTGPNSYSEIAVLSSTSPSSGNAGSITATFTINGPGGSFNNAANGTYTIAQVANTLSDVAGNKRAAGTLGTFTVSVPAGDTTPPAFNLAGSTVPDITTGGTNPYQFTLRFTDAGSGVLRSSLTGAITVTGPNSYSQVATLASTNPASGNAAQIDATYTVPPAGGDWAAGDNGTYTVAMTTGVSDVAGNIAATGILDTFAVNIVVADTTPPAYSSSTSSIPDITTVSTDPYFFTLGFTDAGSGVLISSLGATGAVTVQGPNGYNQNATLVSTNPIATSANAVTANFSIPAPAGGWNALSSGWYLINVTAQIKDVNNNAMAAIQVANLRVDVAPAASEGMSFKDYTFNFAHPMVSGLKFYTFFGNRQKVDLWTGSAWTEANEAGAGTPPTYVYEPFPVGSNAPQQRSRRNSVYGDYIQMDVRDLAGDYPNFTIAWKGQVDDGNGTELLIGLMRGNLTAVTTALQLGGFGPGTPGTGGNFQILKTGTSGGTLQSQGTMFGGGQNFEEVTISHVVVVQGDTTIYYRDGVERNRNTSMLGSLVINGRVRLGVRDPNTFAPGEWKARNFVAAGWDRALDPNEVLAWHNDPFTPLTYNGAGAPPLPQGDLFRTYAVHNSVYDGVQIQRVQDWVEDEGDTILAGRSMTSGAPIWWHVENYPPTFTFSPYGPYKTAGTDYIFDEILLQLFNGDELTAGATRDIRTYIPQIVNFFTTKSPGIKIRIMERWPSRPADPAAETFEARWAATTDPYANNAYFQSVMTITKALYPSRTVLLLPVASVFVEIDKRLRAGTLPGVGTIPTGFWTWYKTEASDNIHPRQIACAVAGLVAKYCYTKTKGNVNMGLYDIVYSLPSGATYRDPEFDNAALMTALKDITWDIVSVHPQAGIAP